MTSHSSSSLHYFALGESMWRTPLVSVAVSASSDAAFTDVIFFSSNRIDIDSCVWCIAMLFYLDYFAHLCSRDVTLARPSPRVFSVFGLWQRMSLHELN